MRPALIFPMALAAALLTGLADAAEPDALLLAIREAQLGLRDDFKNLPPTGAMVKSLSEAKAETQIAPSARRSGIRVSPKFTGGEAVTPKKYEELAKIDFIDLAGRADVCTGIFVDYPLSQSTPFRVLTAAHCSCGRLDSYRIARGAHDTDDSDKRVYRLLGLPVRYGDYSCFLPPEDQPGRDLALLTVAARSPDAPQKGMPIPLIGGWLKAGTMHGVYNDRDTTRLLGIGFGYTGRGSDPPKIAHQAMIPIGSYFCGAGFFARSACAGFREFVLADPQAGAGVNRPDSCGGDSGSPIFWVPSPKGGVTAPNAVLERFLVGITSRALAGVSHNPGTTCGGGGIYSAVAHPDVAAWLGTQGIFVQTERMPPDKETSTR